VIEDYLPPSGPGVRVDSHLYRGYEVPPHYDSLLSKLIVWAPTRDEAIARVRDLTNGLGAHSVLECVGHGESMRTALGIARAGGAVGRVGVPQEETLPASIPTFFSNITIAGGPAPARAYIEELMPDILEGRIQPGRVFDRTTDLDGVPEGYRAMNDREAIKVMIDF